MVLFIERNKDESSPNATAAGVTIQWGGQRLLKREHCSSANSIMMDEHYATIRGASRPPWLEGGESRDLLQAGRSRTAEGRIAVPNWFITSITVIPAQALLAVTQRLARVQNPGMLMKPPLTGQMSWVQGVALMAIF